MSTLLSDYDYILPKELIASDPLLERTHAKLITVDLATKKWHYKQFHHLKNLLNKDDVLVLNDTKVLHARLYGKRKTGAHVEIFLLKKREEQCWEVLLRPGGRLKKGEILILEGSGKYFEIEVLDESSPHVKERRVRFLTPLTEDDLMEIGRMPLPPYIHRDESELDKSYYQTVFAKKLGAVAAPTAGLHFDQALLDELLEKGVQIAFVTLHVSYGTFKPIETEDLKDHPMFSESYEISPESADIINEAKKGSKRIIACGTTCVRALESAVGGKGELIAGKGETDLFIYPPYQFKIIDGLITNFHLPKSSLLMLVSALLGRETLLEIYQDAISHQCRFYSYGDAMVIL